MYNFFSKLLSVILIIKTFECSCNQKAEKMRIYETKVSMDLNM